MLVQLSEEGRLGGPFGLQLGAFSYLRQLPLDRAEPRYGQALRAHVTLGHRPLVVLFSQYGADQAYDGGAVGENADYVGPPTDFFV